MKILAANRLFLQSPKRFLVELLEERLTFENPAYAQVMRFSPYVRTNVPASICLMEKEDDGVYSVPRGFDFTKLPPALAEKFDPRRNPLVEVSTLTSPVKFPRPLLSLNSEQQQLFGAAKRFHLAGKRPFGNFLLVSSTSTGKTILQASLAAYFGQKTLVLCKTNAIQKAWIDDLKKLYGLEGKQVGKIQQSTFRIGEQFTLSSLATLHRRKARWAEIFSHFGCVILDEVHLLPADSIYQFVSACPCKYLIGATATISKNDEKKRRIVYSTFGPPVKELVAVEHETASSMPISAVREVKTNFTLEMSHDMFDYAKVIDSLIGDDNRNSLIVKEARKDWLKGHTVLITTSRVSHVELLAEELRSIGVPTKTLTGDQNSGSYYHNLLTMLQARRVRCLVSTDQLISVGANLPPIDRLHVTVPIKDEEKFTQLCGRIRRKFKGKKDAHVIYYLDRQQSYLFGIYKRTAVPVFRKMGVEFYQRLFLA